MTKLPFVDIVQVNLSDLFYHYCTDDGEAGTFKAAREMIELLGLETDVTADDLVDDFMRRVMENQS